MSAIKSLMAIRQYWFLYVLITPILIYYAVLRFYPMLIQGLLSFKEFRLLGGVWGSPWVGWANFEYLFTRPDFIRALSNTIEISLLRLGMGFWPPIILAILLFDLRWGWLRRFSQTIIYIPHFLSIVIVYGLVFAIFSNTGFVNQMITAIGGEEANFLMSEAWFRPLLIGSAIWKEIGWGTIIYLAGLSAIDQSLYESAMIDGAGPVQRNVYITLPLMLPLIIFLFTLSLGGVLYAGFEQILLYYNPMTYSVGDVIDTWIYRQGLGQLQYSLATAAQFFQSVFGLILVLLANKMSKRFAGVGIW